MPGVRRGCETAMAFLKGHLPEAWEKARKDHESYISAFLAEHGRMPHWGTMLPFEPPTKNLNERLDDIQNQIAELKELVEKAIHGP